MVLLMDERSIVSYKFLFRSLNAIKSNIKQSLDLQINVKEIYVKFLSHLDKISIKVSSFNN